MRQPAQNDVIPDETIEVAPGRRAPYTQLGDWVALSGIDDHAKALYWHLSMHINTERGDREVWPRREELADLAGFKRPQSVDRYIADLVAIGAVEVWTIRYANGMRTRSRYVVHAAPPPGYTGPTTLAEWLARRGDSADEESGSRCAPQRTTVRPGETHETAGQPVVRPSAQRGCAPAHTGSTPERTGTKTKRNKKELSLSERLRAAGVVETEEREIIDWIKNSHGTETASRARAYLRTVAGNGDLAELVADWRASRAASGGAGTPDLPEWCGRCGLNAMPLGLGDSDTPVGDVAVFRPGGRTMAAVNARLRRTATGEPCPDCHPDREQAAAPPAQREPATDTAARRQAIDDAIGPDLRDRLLTAIIATNEVYQRARRTPTIVAGLLDSAYAAHGHDIAAIRAYAESLPPAAEHAPAVTTGETPVPPIPPTGVSRGTAAGRPPGARRPAGRPPVGGTGVRPTAAPHGR